MFKSLGFDPDTKIGEDLRAAEDPLSARKANAEADKAGEKMRALIQKGRLPTGQPHDNKADAFRHAVVSGWMWCASSWK